MPIGDDDVKMIEDGKNLFRSAYCSSFIIADDPDDGGRRSLFGCAATKLHERTEHDTIVHVSKSGEDFWYKDATGHWTHEGPLVEIHTGGADAE